MKKILLAFCAVAALAACSHNASTTPQSRTLVLYYSQNGATQTVAEELQRQLSADIEALQLVSPYDGDFQQTIERSSQERENGTLPELLPLGVDLADYDTVYLGFPVWYGTYALPIASLLADQHFEGKVLVPFCTFGSGGLQSSVDALTLDLPQAVVLPGFGIRSARLDHVAQELDRFLIEYGLKPGTIEALPAFMEHHPVTADEAALFHQACDGYQFPLGTPVDVAVRETKNSTDYEFSAQSDNGSLSTVYVTLAKTEGAQAEFTLVVR